MYASGTAATVTSKLNRIGRSRWARDQTVGAGSASGDEMAAELTPASRPDLARPGDHLRSRRAVRPLYPRICRCPAHFASRRVRSSRSELVCWPLRFAVGALRLQAAQHVKV